MSVEIKNKKAAFSYFLTDSYTAGIQLRGTEIKSIRGGKASIVEAYCKFDGDELFIFNMHIDAYGNAGYVTHEPRRIRKLLMKRTELNKLQRKLRDVGGNGGADPAVYFEQRLCQAGHLCGQGQKIGRQAAHHQGQGPSQRDGQKGVNRGGGLNRGALIALRVNPVLLIEGGPIPQEMLQHVLHLHQETGVGYGQRAEILFLTIVEPIPNVHSA